MRHRSTTNAVRNALKRRPLPLATVWTRLPALQQKLMAEQPAKEGSRPHGFTTGSQGPIWTSRHSAWMLRKQNGDRERHPLRIRIAASMPAAFLLFWCQRSLSPYPVNSSQPTRYSRVTSGAGRASAAIDRPRLHLKHLQRGINPSWHGPDIAAATLISSTSASRSACSVVIILLIAGYSPPPT